MHAQHSRLHTNHGAHAGRRGGTPVPPGEGSYRTVYKESNPMSDTACNVSRRPAQSAAPVRSTSSSGSCLHRGLSPRPPRWALRAGYCLAGSRIHGV